MQEGGGDWLISMPVMNVLDSKAAENGGRIVLNCQFPNRHFPNQQFPNRQFPNRQFPNPAIS